MSLLPGWKIDYSKSQAVTLAADVTEGQVLKLTATDTADVAGAGDIPAGVAPYDVDISEDETRLGMVRGNIAVCAVAAAITDLDIPVKTGAAGTVTPCDTDKDPVVGKPLDTQSTVGGYVRVDLSTLGTYYTV